MNTSKLEPCQGTKLVRRLVTPPTIPDLMPQKPKPSTFIGIAPSRPGFQGHLLNGERCHQSF